MSFILDALRKSENERQHKAAPGIADARRGTARGSRGPWLVILSLLLAANAALVAWLLLRDPAPIGEQVVALPLPDDREPGRLGELKPLPPAIAPVPAGADPLAGPDASQAVVPGAATNVKPTPGAVPPAPVAAPAAAPPPPADDTDRLLPTLQQLILAGLLELRPLRIDMHVYSDDPQQRFVFVNMRKYREGEQLQEGPIVEEITPDGMVLSHQGRRFSLARE